MSGIVERGASFEIVVRGNDDRRAKQPDIGRPHAAAPITQLAARASAGGPERQGRRLWFRRSLEAVRRPLLRVWTSPRDVPVSTHPSTDTSIFTVRSPDGSAHDTPTHPVAGRCRQRDRVVGADVGVFVTGTTATYATTSS